MKITRIIFLLCFVAIISTACVLDEDYIMTFGSYHFWRAPPKYDDSNFSRLLNVAAASFDVDLSPEINRERMVNSIDKINKEKPDVRLILFPETTLGYYYKSSNLFEYYHSIAETVPGKTTNVLSEKAIEYQIYISFGMIESFNGQLYNSQVLIGPDGNIESVHHKNNLYLWENDILANGNGITINIIDNIKVATVICFYIQFFSINKEIHESGAEFVLLPVAGLAGFYTNYIPGLYLPNTWVLSANRFGNEEGDVYDGLIYLLAPSGEIRNKKFGNEGYIYGVVRCK
jgi:predicted amidohydrolase